MARGTRKRFPQQFLKVLLLLLRRNSLADLTMPVIQVPIEVHDWTGSVIEENFVLRRGDRLAASAAALARELGPAVLSKAEVGSW